MHFLKSLIENPTLEEPAKNNFEIHRHFYRYSRGVFIGPALKFRQTSSRISLKGSFEYEDLLEELTLKTVSEDQIKVKGVLITGQDLTDTITDLGLDWKLKKSTGKTKNYKAKFEGTYNKNILLESIETFRSTSYLLLNFNLNNNCKISTKARIPQPSKKKVADDDINKRVSFCTAYIPNNEKNMKMIIEECFPDFKSEISDSWKSLLLRNDYNIDKIEIPKDLEDSRLMRIMAIRKGKLMRTLEIDGDSYEEQYSIVV